MSVGSVSRLGVGWALSTADLDALAAGNDMSSAVSPSSAFETLLSAARVGISPADGSLLLARNDFLNGNNLAPGSANSSDSVSQSGAELTDGVQDDVGVGTSTQRSSVDAVALLTIVDGASAQVEDPSAQSVSFQGPTGTLKLDDAGAFAGQVSGLSGSDALDLGDIKYGANTTATYLGNSSGGVLTVSDGTHTANIDLVGNYLSSSWDLSSDSHGGTMVVDPVAPNNWQELDVGAGGWLTGMDIAPDDTMVVRTDTYGAYLWNGTKWQQLVTATSMPAGTGDNGGVYEIQIAPSNSNILYMMYGGSVFESTNKGTTWTQTAFAPVTENPNDPYRMDGQKMAVDPNNPNVVYVGTPQNGLFVTGDGGASWQNVSAIPVSLSDGNGNYPGITGIEFDPALGASGGKTNTIFAASYGNGVYESTNAGASWSAIGGPTSVESAAVSSTGVYYVIGNGNSLWSYAKGGWTELVADGQSYQTVAVDPFNPNEIVLQTDSGVLNISYDAGATWSGPNWGNQLSSPDIPWLASTGSNYMSIGATVFDQLVPNKLWTSDGVGVWNTTNLPTSNFNWATPVVWNDQSVGIEQLVANEIIVPPGGHPVVASWDRPFFDISNPNAYPSSYGPGGFAAGWSLDYASSNPSFIVGIADWWGPDEQSGYSTNGGQTWTAFPSFIPGAGSNFIGGTIAASTPQNIIWAPADNQQPYYTLDGGTTWNPITLPGVSSWSGFDWAYYLDTRTVTADRVLANTFYLYNYQYGLFESTNGGVNWTEVHNGPISQWSGDNAELQSVPGEAGNLFFASGPLGGGTQTGFQQSTDQGATWTNIPNVNQVNCFGFGAPAPGQSYPSIYIVGWVNNVYGIWQSSDDAHSWVQIGTYPEGSLDGIKTISGDPNVYGQVYVGFSGSGYAYLPAATSTTPTGADLGSTPSSATSTTPTGTDLGSTPSSATSTTPTGTDLGSTPSSATSTTPTGTDLGSTPSSATSTTPTVTGVAPSSSVSPTVSAIVKSPASADLNAGKIVTLTLNLSEAVTVTGAPTLTLNDGGTATYTSGSGSNALTFSYTVAAGQNISSLAATAVNLNAGTIADAVGNTANLSLAGLGQTGPQIDTIAPSVSSLIESPSSGELAAGQTVTLTLNMSEAVTVAGGIPTLSLNNGGTATYTSGSGTSALTFTYMVGAGQNTSDLAVTGIDVNAATISDTAGNTADLSLNGLIQSGPQTNTVAPDAPVIAQDSPHIDTVAPPAPVIAHDSVHGNHVVLTGTAQAHDTVSVYDGQTFLASKTANASGGWSYTTGPLTTGSHTFSATATDSTGNTSSSSNLLDPFIGKHSVSALGSPVSESSTLHSGADGSMNTSTSGVSSSGPLEQGLTSDTSVPIDASNTSTGPQWQIDVSKLRDMIGSLQAAHKSILSSDAHLSDSNVAELLNSGPDAFSFNSDLTEEISKHPHSGANSAEVTQQLDAVYAQLRAEFQTATADSAPAITNDATTMSHDVGDHLHLHALHLM